MTERGQALRPEKAELCLGKAAMARSTRGTWEGGGWADSEAERARGAGHSQGLPGTKPALTLCIPWDISRAARPTGPYPMCSSGVWPQNLGR